MKTAESLAFLFTFVKDLLYYELAWLGCERLCYLFARWLLPALLSCWEMPCYIFDSLLSGLSYMQAVLGSQMRIVDLMKTWWNSEWVFALFIAWCCYFIVMPLSSFSFFCFHNWASLAFCCFTWTCGDSNQWQLRPSLVGLIILITCCLCGRGAK